MPTHPNSLWGAPRDPPGNFQIPTNPSNSDLNRSALTVGNVVTGALTGGGPATSTQLGRQVAVSNDAIFIGNEIGYGTSFTHWNNPITSTFKTLTGGLITDSITLFPDALANGNIDPPNNTNPQSGPTLTFDFKFLETTNQPQSGICADGLGWNAGGRNGCPDLFGFQGTSVINLSFAYLGDTYYIQFLTLDANLGVDTIGIGTLTAGECTALNLNNGCFGFRTQEGQSTTERFGFAITAAPISVPEPGSLALLGLGLFGIGRMMRRKIAA